MTELDDIPADELAAVLDTVLWDMTPPDRDTVAAWLAHLHARADADTPPVRLAADVCMEYLAEPGSRFEAAIGKRVSEGFRLSSASDSDARS